MWTPTNDERSIPQRRSFEVRELHLLSRLINVRVDNHSTIMDDPFIRSYIGELLRSLRTQYLIDLIKPYTRLELSFLARQLNVKVDEVEELLIGLILEGKVEGRIDQVAMRLELDRKYVHERLFHDNLRVMTMYLQTGLGEEAIFCSREMDRSSRGSPSGRYQQGTRPCTRRAGRPSYGCL